MSTNKQHCAITDIKKPRCAIKQSAALWIKGEQSFARKLVLFDSYRSSVTCYNSGGIDSL